MARQLSHSLEMEKKYYELTKGSHHAAKAVTLLLDPVTSLAKAGNSSIGQSGSSTSSLGKGKVPKERKKRLEYTDSQTDDITLFWGTHSSG